MLLKDILCEWRLVKDYFECGLFWVGGGGCGIILGGWGVSGSLFWVGGGGGLWLFFWGGGGGMGLSSGEYAGCTV